MKSLLRDILIFKQIFKNVNENVSGIRAFLIHNAYTISLLLKINNNIFTLSLLLNYCHIYLFYILYHSHMMHDGHASYIFLKGLF